MKLTMHRKLIMLLASASLALQVVPAGAEVLRAEVGVSGMF